MSRKTKSKPVKLDARAEAKRKTFAQAVEILAGAENEIIKATSTLFKQDSLFNFP